MGLEPGELIEVDDTLRAAGTPWLYAVGDVNWHSLLTRMGKYQARVAAAVIAGENARATYDDAGAPRVIFHRPRDGRRGLTFAQARDRRIDAHAYDVPTSTTPGASFHGRNTAGTSRLVVDARGHRGLRMAACRHRRAGRRSSAGSSVARRAGVPDAQRGLAAPDREGPRGPAGVDLIALDEPSTAAYRDASSETVRSTPLSRLVCRRPSGRERVR